jgi:release factor glutamine methyltransferase
MLIGEALCWAEGFLARSGVSSPRLDAEVLLAEILRRDRSFLFSHPEFLLSSEAEELLRIWIGRRSHGLPVAYILGKKEFWSLEFMVTPAVLIPRPETEVLVSISIERAQEGKTGRIAEVGCGSGAVLVSLAIELKESRFCAIDSSPDALWVARRNARRYGIEERVFFLQGSLLTPVEDRGWKGEVDLVISNPPYIPREETSCLPCDIRLYEPKKALDGGRDGLSFYRQLIPQAAGFLRPGGWLIVEVGKGQSRAIRRLLSRSEDFPIVTVTRDYQGVERVVSARRREG